LLALLVAAYILTAAYLLGAEALFLCRLCRSDGDLPLAERSAFSVGTGVVLMAYLILAIGLLGVLRPWVVLTVVGACGVAGVRRVPALLAAVRSVAGAVWRGVVGPTRRRALHIFLLLWSLITLLAALAPPVDTDYDGLSQHLATPKIHLRHGRIEPLWFDHHSHFPSTLQMLFTAALAGRSAEAAKVVHWACAIGSALLLVLIGRRFLSPAAGEWAAFALLTVPLTAWLAQVAYVDLGSVFFAALLLLGFLMWDRSRSTRQLLLAACAAGGGMAVKMQGIQIFLVGALLVIAAGVLARHAVARVAGQAAAFSAVAAVLAAPWYIKSALWTGNPVYPFAYQVFGGRYWGPGEAATYHEHQLGFGVGSPPPPEVREEMGFLARTFSGPRSPANLLLAPWNVVMRPSEFDVVNVSPIYAAMCLSTGPLFLAILPLVLLRAPRRAEGWALAFLAPLWLAWLMLMQYNRYLLPALAFAAVPVGFVLADALPDRGPARAIPRGVAWTWGGIAMGFMVLQGLASGSWWAGLGFTGRSEYLASNSECYRMAQWVNKLTPPEAKIALYSEPRGFYLDRDYLWADPGHSRLIEYDRVHSGDDLLAQFTRLGVTHVLYRRLPGATDVFDLEAIGPALQELRERGAVGVIGRPATDPDYILLAIEPSGRRASRETMRPQPRLAGYLPTRSAAP
jgi:4-amino-4-deoxy-L-arabinose transferase-like glycosyltransferase